MAKKERYNIPTENSYDWKKYIWSSNRWDAGEINFVDYVDRFYAAATKSRRGIRKLIPENYFISKLLHSISYASPKFVKYMKETQKKRSKLKLSEFILILKEQFYEFQNSNRDNFSFQNR